MNTRDDCESAYISLRHGHLRTLKDLILPEVIGLYLNKFIVSIKSVKCKFQ